MAKFTNGVFLSVVVFYWCFDIVYNQVRRIVGE